MVYRVKLGCVICNNISSTFARYALITTLGQGTCNTFDQAVGCSSPGDDQDFSKRRVSLF